MYLHHQGELDNDGHHDDHHDDYNDDYHNDYHYHYHGDDINHSGIFSPLARLKTQTQTQDVQERKNLDLLTTILIFFSSSELDRIWNCPNYMINHPMHHSFSSVNLLIIQLQFL